MKHLIMPFIAVLLFVMSNCSERAETEKSLIHIVPKPVKIIHKNEVFCVDNDTKIIVPEGNVQAGQIAAFLSEAIEQISGIKPVVTTRDKASSFDGCFEFKIEDNQHIKTEGYRLTVTSSAVRISAGENNGLFYGLQTLFQLFPPKIYGQTNAKSERLSLPGVEITDYQAFAWRGMHLDVSRHFFPVDFIKRYIDLIAMHKMNVFHWHLTDCQGWRIEIKKYPELTQKAAWRVDKRDSAWNAMRYEPYKEGDTRPKYGGFYTQDEIKEIVKYAGERFVTVVPEIEMPGHSTAALCCYPELSCAGETAGYKYLIRNDAYCAGNDSVFVFLQHVLSEVFELFPSKYIHIGGDEVAKQAWKKCKHCQKRIKQEGLKDENELQSYFIRRIQKFAQKHGKQIIGWDEILEGGLAPNAIVMSWRGFEGGLQAAKQGHKVVMTPFSHCYFNFYQGNPEFEPVAWGGHLPLEKVYDFNPAPPGLSQQDAEHIIGSQGNLWTEYIQTEDIAEYMVIPRMCALAEVLWSDSSQRNYRNFMQRMETHFKRFDAMNVNYSLTAYDVKVNSRFDTVKNTLEVVLQTDAPNSQIYYSLDDADLSTDAMLYRKPVVLDKTTTLYAGVFRNKALISRVCDEKFAVHKASGKKVIYKNDYHEKYSAKGNRTLTDGRFGSKNFNDGFWQGFEGADLLVVIDLERVQTIQRISSSYFQRVRSWIFLPEFVEYSVSNDGIHFTTIGKLKNTIPKKTENVVIKPFELDIKPISCRFVKVRAKTIGTCPAWHYGAGKPAWLFADEIVVQ